MTWREARPTARSRATAVVEILGHGTPAGEALALDVEREYWAHVRIQGSGASSGVFRSPLGDERWREVVEGMRSSASSDRAARAPFRRVFDAGRRLYDTLAALDPGLRAFLQLTGNARRLVIASDRPEIHRLPWEAMVDASQRQVAEGDLSVVHAAPNAFDPAPWIAPEALRVAAIFGPDTPGSTRAALDQMRAAGTVGRGLVGEVVRAASEQELRSRLTALGPDLVHVEAHGDNVRGTIALADGVAADPVKVQDLLGARPIVLFWSCYSGLMQSWGESAGLTLHRAGAHLVVGFSTEVRQETAADVASRFYRVLLDPRDGGDPEMVLVRERARLATEERLGCVWASLTVWLRRPLDLTAVAGEGPRLPEGAWADEGDSKTADRLAAALRDAGEGSYRILAGLALPATLPRSLVTRYPGAVVRLSGPSRLGGAASLSRAAPRAILRALGGAEPESDHPGDAVLALLRTLATYRRSLLVWSDASHAEVAFLGLLDGLPPNLAVLATTTADAADAPIATPPAATFERLGELVELGRFDEAGRMWRALEGEAARLEPEQWQRRLAYEVDGFWVAVKSRCNAEAAARTAALEAASKAAPEAGARRLEFECHMLGANLLQREARHDDAYTRYLVARQLAEEAKSDALVGRASAEMGYLVAEMGDVVAAEQLYRDALRMLARTEDPQDLTWRSALARALRDLADLLVDDRREEARLLLRRSIALHALDGRSDQVGAALRTRGRLAAVEGEVDLAERSLEASAAVYAETRNVVGWAATMRALADLALRCGRHEQCTSVLTRLIANLQQEPASRRHEIGPAALQLARAYSRLGQHDEALHWCREATRLLPEAMRRERTEASNLEGALAPLVARRRPVGRGARTARKAE